MEHSHLKNRRYAKGNPDAFAFGPSTWVKLADVKQTLERVFTHAGRTGSEAPRNVVLVSQLTSSSTCQLRSELAAGWPRAEE